MTFTFYSYLISFSYCTFYILSCDVISLTWNSGNNQKIWYLGDLLIKFNETWQLALTLSGPAGATKWTIWLVIMVVMATHSSPVPSLPISIWSISNEINSNFCNYCLLLLIIHLGVVISLNRYNMQTSSARGLQEEICEKEEKRLGASVFPW
jgi:hypothetical protein